MRRENRRKRRRSTYLIHITAKVVLVECVFNFFQKLLVVLTVSTKNSYRLCKMYLKCSLSVLPDSNIDSGA